MEKHCSSRLHALLEKIYPDLSSTEIALLEKDFSDLIGKTRDERKGKDLKTLKCSEDDVALICYGDSFTVQKSASQKLNDLGETFEKHLSDVFSSVHILPFYPFTSDDGFSVSHYKSVRSDLGEWKDVERLAKKTSVMADFVSNHCSAQHPWFLSFLNGEEGFEHFFLSEEEIDMNEEDIQKVVRPRTSSLFHKYHGKAGEKSVWTTFSQDQVDLNYKNPKVLKKVLEVLCVYFRHGISIIRIDAVPFLWKEKGTSCSHLPKTHAIVQLFKEICVLIDPKTILITESNVPHFENISYFGVQDPSSKNFHIPIPEADMVYNFSLAPLLLHTLMSQNSEIFSTWLLELKSPKNKFFFNFLASHDGIGLRGAEGYLDTTDLKNLEFLCKKNGGKVSYKTGLNGKKKVYELNCTWGSMLHSSELSDEMNAQKFLLSHAILLALNGVPAVYYNSLLGQKNRKDEVLDGERSTYRRINRLPLDGANFENEEGYDSIFIPLSNIIKARKQIPAFSPHASQTVFTGNFNTIAFERGDIEGEKVLAVYNISHHLIEFHLPVYWRDKELVDALSGENKEIKNGHIEMQPYDFFWIQVR